jgi:hypothetical protein
MPSSMSFARNALLSLAGLALLPAAAIAAPPRPALQITAAPDHSLLTRVFDDRGGRKRIYSCCHARYAGRSAGTLGTGTAPRLGNDNIGPSGYGNHDWRGAYGGDDPVYGTERLAPSRTYQTSPLGGGYFGDSPLDNPE